MVVEHDGIRSLPQLNYGSNNRVWSTVIRSVLRSYLSWDIVSSVEIIAPAYYKASDETSKISCKERFGSCNIIADTALSLSLFRLKRDAESCSFILYTIEFAPLDDIDASSTSKQLWDYQQSKYRERIITLRKNLFIHLVIIKLNEYP